MTFKQYESLGLMGNEDEEFRSTTAVTNTDESHQIAESIQISSRSIGVLCLRGPGNKRHWLVHGDMK